MKTFFRRLRVPSGRRKWVVPASTLLTVVLLAGLWFLGHSGSNSVWNQASTPISDVLDRVDRGEIAGASINGQHNLVTDIAGRKTWTIEKESSMSTTEQYLRGHGVRVAVESTDETSFATMLPNLLGVLVVLALLFILLRRSSLLGNPMGAMTKHLGEARAGDLEQVTFSQVVGVDEAKHELEEVVAFLKAPAASVNWAPACRAASCWSARPAPARRCSHERSRVRPGSPTSRSLARTSSRCSSAWAPPGCEISSGTPRRTRPAASSRLDRRTGSPARRFADPDQ